jgi:tyrosyl-tRNA synthetase
MRTRAVIIHVTYYCSIVEYKSRKFNRRVLRVEVNSMNVDQKLQLIQQRSEEILTVEDLSSKLEQQTTLTGYVGFELSGFVHIGNGCILGRQVQDLTEAGVEMKILLADWHSLINNKLGADMDAIRIAGEYFEVAFRTMGASGNKVKYLWGSDIVDNADYWMRVVQVAKNTTLTRLKRALPIMGRKDTEDMEGAFLFYPPMQAADIFEMKLDIALGGMDQRHVHVLAREVADRVGANKPVAIHTPMLMGLKGPDSRMDSSVDIIDIKMSKSKPETCVFLHDGPKSIAKKLKKAYCPKGELDKNSVLEIARLVLFKESGFKLTVERPEKFGGDISFKSYPELSKAYLADELHPLDLKMGIASSLSDYLKDARQRLEKKDDVMEMMSKLTNVPLEFE